MSYDLPGSMPIPADIELPDKILAGLTARQVAIIIIITAAAVITWAGFEASRRLVPLPVLAALAAPVAVAAAALVIGQRDGLSLDRLLIAAWRQARSPRRFVIAPGGIPAPPAWASPRLADEVLAVADALGAGVAKALLGKASVPDDVPYCTGSIGLLGTKPSWDMMQDADTLLMVGSSFPYSKFLPTTGQAKAVQIDLSPRMLSIRYPMDLALVGAAKDTLAELLPLLNRKPDRTWQDKIVGNVRDWWELMDDAGQPSDLNGRVRPQGLFASLSRHLPDNAILSSDSGTAADWYARHIRIRRGMKASLSGNLATMVPGVPYGMAAKFAFSDRVAVAMVGDGAMQMGGMAEMLTAAKYYKMWADPRFVVMVLNNEDLNQVTWEQRAMEGDPRFEASQAIPYVSYADWADMIGLKGIKITRSDQIEAAFEEAFAADRPVIVDALTTPDEPPMPPHVTFAQARALTKSVLADPSGGFAGAKEGVREMVQELVHRKD